MVRTLALGFLVLLVGCAKSDGTDATDASQPSEPPVSSGASAQTGDASADAGDRDVELPAIRLKAPESWVKNTPRNQLVAAEFGLPRAEGDDKDGRLTISLARGGVEANINRWRGQFETDLARQSQEDLQVVGTTITVVDFSGTYNDQQGPFAPGEKREDYRMIGAIIPVDGQLHFIKAYGPEQTLAKHADSIREFLQTLEVK